MVVHTYFTHTLLVMDLSSSINSHSCLQVRFPGICQSLVCAISIYSSPLTCFSIVLHLFPSFVNTNLLNQFSRKWFGFYCKVDLKLFKHKQSESSFFPIEFGDSSYKGRRSLYLPTSVVCHSFIVEINKRHFYNSDVKR